MLKKKLCAVASAVILATTILTGCGGLNCSNEAIKIGKEAVNDIDSYLEHLIDYGRASLELRCASDNLSNSTGDDLKLESYIFDAYMSLNKYDNLIEARNNIADAVGMPRR